MKVGCNQLTPCCFVQEKMKTCCIIQFISAFHLCAAYDAFVPPTTDVKATIIISTKFFPNRSYLWFIFRLLSGTTQTYKWVTMVNVTYYRAALHLADVYMLCSGIFPTKASPVSLQDWRTYSVFFAFTLFNCIQFFAAMYQVIIVLEFMFTFSFVLWTLRIEWCTTSTIKATKITLSLVNKFSKCCHRYGYTFCLCKYEIRYWH